MAEHTEDRSERSAALHQLTKTDPDPRVRRRAQALLLVEAGHSQASVARLLQTSAYRVHVWCQSPDTSAQKGRRNRRQWCTDTHRQQALVDGGRLRSDQVFAVVVVVGAPPFA
jgi:Homeodomain-like domain-containing protein